MDLQDLMNLVICKNCGHAFMPTEEQIESYIVTEYCKQCKIKR